MTIPQPIHPPKKSSRITAGMPRNRAELERAIGLDFAYRIHGWLTDRGATDLADELLFSEVERCLHG